MNESDLPKESDRVRLIENNLQAVADGADAVPKKELELRITPRAIRGRGARPSSVTTECDLRDPLEKRAPDRLNDWWIELKRLRTGRPGSVCDQGEEGDLLG